MSLDAADFFAALKLRGFRFFAGVPDSTFGGAFEALLKDDEVRYVPAVREDVALGVASAAYFNGSKAAVIMQNSGLGNVVNPLTSFNLLYKVPVLMIIGWRGFGGPATDAPEHWIMGDKTAALLDLFGLPHELLDPDALELGLDRLLTVMDETSQPGALLVPPGAFA